MEIPGCALPGDGTSRSPLAQLWLELGKLLGVAVELTCGYSPGYQPPSLGKQLGYNFHNYACINPLSSQDPHFEVRQLEEVKEQMGTLRPCEALKTQEDSRMRPAQYTVYMFRHVHDQMCTHMILYIYIYIYIYTSIMLLQIVSGADLGSRTSDCAVCLCPVLDLHGTPRGSTVFPGDVWNAGTQTVGTQRLCSTLQQTDIAIFVSHNF